MLSFCSQGWSSSGLFSALLRLMDQFVGQASWSHWSLYNLHIWVLQENVFSGVHFSEPMFFSSVVPFGKVLQGLISSIITRKRKLGKNTHHAVCPFTLQTSPCPPYQALCWRTAMNKTVSGAFTAHGDGNCAVMSLEPYRELMPKYCAPSPGIPFMTALLSYAWL